MAAGGRLMNFPESAARPQTWAHDAGSPKPGGGRQLTEARASARVAALRLRSRGNAALPLSLTPRGPPLPPPGGSSDRPSSTATRLPETCYLRQPEVLVLVPISRSTLWRRIQAGTFPGPVKLSARETAWRAEDVCRWIAEPGGYRLRRSTIDSVRWGTTGHVSGAPTRTQASARVESSHFGSGMAEEW